MAEQRVKRFLLSRRGGSLFLFVLVFLFFADLLIGPGDRVISEPGKDIWRQFAGWRQFGFEQIRHGNFPFWNPLVYGGMPYFSGSQSALLYPPNWLHLALPLHKAITWVLALHIWWIGTGMLLWVRALGRSPSAALFAAIVVMFGAPHFLHVYAGHLTNLCVMAWMPWLFLVLRRWRAAGSIHWVVAGGLVIAMQILGGHPQYVYYGAIVASLYAILQLFEEGPRRWRFLAGVAAMYLVAAALAAIQLFPAIEAMSEMTRVARADKVFSASYSFPPENLLTTIVPGFFGDMRDIPYWGRWFYWEMSAFFGVIALWCAALAIRAGRAVREWRTLWIGLTVCVILALGSYTPLFDLLFAVLPGFDLFRGLSKFMFFATLFAGALAALGLDLITSREPLRGERFLLIGGVGLILMCVLGAVVIGTSRAGGHGAWELLRARIWQTGQVTHVPQAVFNSAEFAAESAVATSRSLWLAAVLLALAVAGTVLRRFGPIAGKVMLAAGAVELLFFAAAYRSSFELTQLLPEQQLTQRAQHPGDYRVIDLTRVHAGMLTKLPDVWGDDPGVLRRYADFVARSQGLAPGVVKQKLAIVKASPRWDLLRVRHLFRTTSRGVMRWDTDAPILRRFELVPDFQVVRDRDVRLQRLFAPDFDPSAVVLLEDVPVFAIAPEPGGTVRGDWQIENADTDTVDIRVQNGRSAFLLITDPYSTGWRVRNLASDPPQEHYMLVPANHAFMAIPLDAGRHSLRLSYMPRTFKSGMVISGLAVLICGFTCLFPYRNR